MVKVHSFKLMTFHSKLDNFVITMFTISSLFKPPVPPLFSTTQPCRFSVCSKIQYHRSFPSFSFLLSPAKTNGPP
ncbi:Uncharacterized protein TCM_004155 [Theobroma cacao]|uniref:Uncharacterized protein n=1 Tax=Theobroma cacao TaxID=3641 RepID=A0A061DP98_THECC|nr:Uncharacterized protein TCM_004155 [Theobroma cacao]